MKYVISVMLISFLAIFGLFYVVIAMPSDVFQSSYQSVIQTKFDRLVHIDEPKIIIIGGSSAGFGIDEKLMEEETGYKVVNLGLHAGFGGLFNTELSKANINPGDIVLLAYEYDWYGEGCFDSLGVDLVMSGIDSRIDMYRYIPLRKLPEILGYLFRYAETKRTYQPATGVYSRSSFDSEGRMVIKRESYVIEDYENQKAHYGSVNLENASISKKSESYLRSYKKYVEKKHAKVYFVAPPLLSLANESKETDMLALAEMEEEKIGIPYLSNPNDYVFSKELMFDTIYHCNSKGERRRTELLIQDIKPYLNN